MNSFIAWFDSKENKNSVVGNNLESTSQTEGKLLAGTLTLLRESVCCLENRQ
jgi:hypothetical protein